MCCKPECCYEKKIRIPLGGVSGLAAEQVEFTTHRSTIAGMEEHARRFKEWMYESVSAPFYAALRRELNK